MSSVSGVLWKCKYGMTGAVYWKKKFTYLDHEKLLHWQSDRRPTEGDKSPPRHGFLLQRCDITEEPKMRPYAFKLTDRVDKRSMVFATETLAEYEKWLEILMGEHVDPATLATATGDAEQLDDTEGAYDFDFDFEHDDEATVGTERGVTFSNTVTQLTSATSTMSLTAGALVARDTALANANTAPQHETMAKTMTMMSLPMENVVPKRTVKEIATVFFERNDAEVRL
jgi:hypothetical protein